MEPSAMDTTAAAMPSSAVDAASSLLEVPEKPPLDTVILKQEDMHSLMQAVESLKGQGLTLEDERYRLLVRVLKTQGALVKERQVNQTGVEAMTTEQRKQLVAQLHAYRYMIKGTPLPDNVKQTLNIPTPINGSIPPSPPLPRAHMISVAASAKAKAVVPNALDAFAVDLDREARIEAAVSMRLQLLQDAIDSLKPKTDNGEEIPPETETLLKLKIEQKALQLLSFQRLVRGKILLQYREQDSLLKETGGRPNPPALGLDSPVLTQRLDTERRRQAAEEREKSHRGYINAVISYQKKYKDLYTERKVNWDKVMKQFLKVHLQREKKKQQLAEKREKDRILALKNDDEDAYWRLVSETKNDRLSLLLEQTSSFLNQIGALVQQEQEDMIAAKEREEQEQRLADLERKAEGGDTESKRRADSLRNALKLSKDIAKKEKDKSTKKSQNQRNKTYYSDIHKVQEEINEQPKILSGGTLKEYQMSGLQWLVSLYNNNLNGILADEMGLGKTIQTIALLCYLMEVKKNNGPFLIVVPLSTITNWASELKAWAPTIDVVLFKGNAELRKDLYKKKIATGHFNVVLTTFEFVTRAKAQLCKPKWKYIIVDEGHRMKNKEALTTRVLTQNYKSQHRLILSGTPLQNQLSELWSLLNFLLPTIFNSVDNFEQWFSAPFANTGESMQLTEEESLLIIKRLHKVLRPFLLRRLKSEVLTQLPEKVERVVMCEMSAMQRKMYDNLKNSGTIGVKKKGLTNDLIQFRKICNHPFLIQSPTDITLDDSIWRVSGKFELLDRILPKLKASGHRVLIFTQFTEVLTLLEDFCKWREVKYLRLDGSTKADDRGELMRVFNAPNSPFFLFMLSTRAGGLGINLQTADTVILFDSDWNPQMDLQAQDRVHRFGQKNEVIVLRLITSKSIEERILETAQLRLDMDNKVIEAGKFDMQSKSGDRDKLLLRLLREKGDDEEDEKEVPTEEDLNRVISRSNDEFELFQEMDQKRMKEEKELSEKYPENPAYKSRLYTEEELPDWLKVDVKAAIEEEKFSEGVKYGRGHRERTAPGTNVLADEVDEETFIKMMEEKERAMREKVPRGRNNKRKAEDAKGGPATKRARTDPSERIVPMVENPSPELLQVWKGQYLKIFQYLREVKDLEGDQERVRSEIFMYLPHELYYPDYYVLIKNPIAMDMIRERIEGGEYKDPQHFYDDFVLLFKNAKTYNLEGSPVYNDAVALSELFETEFQERFVSKFEHTLRKSLEIKKEAEEKAGAIGIDGEAKLKPIKKDEDEMDEEEEQRLIIEQLDKDDKKLLVNPKLAPINPTPDNMDSYLDMMEEEPAPPPSNKPKMLTFDFDDNEKEKEEDNHNVKMVDVDEPYDSSSD